MKKWLTIIGCLVVLLWMPALPAFARAGGSTGGGGSAGGSTGGGGSTYVGGGTSSYGGGYYGGRGYGRGAGWALLAPLGFIGILAGRNRYKQRQFERNLPHDVGPIDPQLAAQFEELFYTVESAWSQTDQEQLVKLMTPPDYYDKQKRILTNWQKEGKINRLDNVAIVDLQQEFSDPHATHVVVVAQAKDYFEYPHQSEQYNQFKQDEALIQRFTEVWELTTNSTGQLIVENIRQS
ncbi:hypothetical protein [Lentilactobacillus senioris]|uniref:hypothetical protein n=1 Tax=Lentilactobacillus senioris TaxID=931534 RepID=UPI0006D24C83|nr:hypothetical protein [Lentilactobacillus senioris]